MKKSIVKSLIVAALALTVSACGGNSSGTAPSDQPTTAIIKISVQGTPSNSPLTGIQATLRLPQGVSVKATQNAPQTDTGAVTATGNAEGAELVMGIYSAVSGTVSIYVAKSSGIAVGEFATVNCDIAAGTTPIKSDFNIPILDLRDQNGAIVSGLTPTLSVSLQ